MPRVYRKSDLAAITMQLEKSEGLGTLLFMNKVFAASLLIAITSFAWSAEACPNFEGNFRDGSIAPWSEFGFIQAGCETIERDFGMHGATMEIEQDFKAKLDGTLCAQENETDSAKAQFEGEVLHLTLFVYGRQYEQYFRLNSDTNLEMIDEKGKIIKTLIRY